MISRFHLLLALLLPFTALAVGPAPAGPAPVAGTDYQAVENGAPYAPVAGKIEVAEVFAYWCHHCANFEPRLDAWKSKLPKDVRVTYVPLPAGPGDPFARGFFAAQAAGKLDVTHAATFRAVHAEHSLPRNPTIDELASFYGHLGLDAARLKADMESAALAGKLKAAHEFAVRSGVEGTPTLIVNGKYRVTGRTLDEALRIADHLIARERAAARSARR